MIDLTPPDSNPSSFGSEPRRAGRNLLLAVLAALVLAVGAVVFMLPLMPERQTTESESMPSPSAPAASSDSRAAAQPATDTDQDLKAWLAIQDTALAENIDQWAASEYREILNTANQADVLLAGGNASEAAQRYRQATVTLRDLLEEKSTRLTGLIERAATALDAGETDLAVTLFQQAAAINPDNQEVRTGLDQARKRGEVITLYNDANDLERQGDLVGALKKLDALLGLDGAFKPGQEARSRLTALLDERQFKQDMTDFYTALDAGELGAAKSALERWRQQHHNSPELEQAGKLLADKEEAAALARLREQAEVSVRQERWPEALAAYTKVLKLMPDALFALQGKELAEKRIRLDAALDKLISTPQRLREQATRQAAGELLEHARTINPAGPRLTSQINTLQQAVAEAGTPVTVKLESDNQTEIVIYRFGRLGRFVNKELVLTPGTYTIVGSRTGYRDVRKNIDIDPRNPPDRAIPIICNEQI